MDNPKIGLRFIGIHTVSKDMFEMPSDFPNSATHQFNFEIKAETKVQAEKSIVMSVVHVTISETNKPLKLAKVVTACLFEIEDFVNVIKKNDNDLYHIPDQLEALIRPVAISTVRGIIYSEFRGTYLNNAIMPIVFMDTFKVNKPTEEVE